MTSPSGVPRPSTSRHPTAGRPLGAPVSFEHVAAILRGLNREQRRAVTHGEGPQLVHAGPGTGKTEVVTRRVAWLIATKRAAPREILALTFTEKAAAEMQARVDVLVPYGQADASIHTFHAFGDRLVREHAFELGLAGDVRLIGRAEAILLLRDNLFSLGLDRYLPLGDPTRFLGALVDLFGRAKEEGISPAALAANAQELLARSGAVEAEAERESLRDLGTSRLELAAAYDRYVALMSTRGLIDHGDQVALALRLLRERPATRLAVQSQYRYVLVDEFQDTNPTQLELVVEVTGPHRSVTAVGDDDQAIYAFRGAAAGNMAAFVAAYPHLRRVALRRNYRSRAPVIAASSRLIRHNGAERLATRNGFAVEPVAHRRSRLPAPVRQLAFEDGEQEADGVARIIAARVRGGERPNRFAILVRSNAETDGFARSLRAHGLPARTNQPQNLYELPAVRALMAFLRVAADPASSMELYALATSEPYRLGGAELTQLLHDARRHHLPLWDVVQAVADGSRGASRLADHWRRAVRALVGDVRAAIDLSHERSTGELLYDHLRRSGRLAALARPDASVEQASELTAIARFFSVVRQQGSLLAEDRVAFLVPHLGRLAESADEEADTGPHEEDAVAVMTVHRAKGLEFDVVFVAGLNDGRFPTRARRAALELPPELLRSAPVGDDDAARLREERRLCYVAMTRARDELWLTYASAAGRGRASRRPSIFVAEALDTLAAVPEPVVVAPAERIEAAAAHPEKTLAVVPAAATEGGSGGLSLSFSQLDDYITCPERYRLRHVLGVPAPAHHSLTYGSALHQAAAAFHLAQARGRTMSEDELLTSFAQAWSGEGFLSREHEEARFAAGMEALRRFRTEQLAPGVPVPVAVEKRFSFTVGRDTVRGRIDRLDSSPEGEVITDYKSSDVRDQRRADEKARESLQLGVYALAHEAETGRRPLAVQLSFLETGVVGRAEPDPRRLERAREKVAAVADEIRSGLFPPRPNPIACGYCPYRQICHASAV